MTRLALAALSALALALPARADDTADFLKADNWRGLDGFWTVEGTTVTGQSKEPLSYNTFLCSKTKYKDFELSFQVELLDAVGNSGVQIRSKVEDEKVLAVGGPQVDVGQGFWGSLYGERFGGMMKASDGEAIKKAVKPTEFNAYEIKSVGKRVTIKINGTTMVDEEFEKMPEEGIIAWQLHGGPAMRVTFKDVVFKNLSK